MNITAGRIIFVVKAARGSLSRNQASTQSEIGVTGNAPHVLQNLPSISMQAWQLGQRRAQISTLGAAK
jgi:hypothetical protein